MLNYAVGQEIRQEKGFRTASQAALLVLFRTSDIVRRRFSDLVARDDLTLQQYNVLRILRGAGPAGLPTLEIAGRMVEHSPGITRIIDRLIRKGWVRRDRSGSDRRMVLCRITAEGRRVLAGLDSVVQWEEDHWLDSLTEAEREQLIALLDRIRADADADIEKQTGNIVD